MPAVFLDRDGVLMEDIPLLTDCDRIRILPGVAGALHRLGATGFRLVVITNQAIVARGLMPESGVQRMNIRLSQLLVQQGAPAIDAFYFCPHHPNATLPAYRVECSCRKPEPGLIFQAAADHSLDLKRSFFVGDRPTDILAGARAGCRTVLVQTGMKKMLLIETARPLERVVQPDQVCRDLAEAVAWILEVR